MAIENGEDRKSLQDTIVNLEEQLSIEKKKSISLDESQKGFKATSDRLELKNSELSEKVYRLNQELERSKNHYDEYKKGYKRFESSLKKVKSELETAKKELANSRRESGKYLQVVSYNKVISQ